MNEDLETIDWAKDTTLEAVILDKLSADYAYEGVIRKEFYAPTGTWIWTPDVRVETE